MIDSSNNRPAVKVKTGGAKRLALGHPWVYSNEIVMAGETKGIAPGSLVNLVAAESGRGLGVASFNRHTLIAARLFDLDPSARIDSAWIVARLDRAAALRDQLFEAPCYRLIHAEADGLPGFIVDRYGDAFVLQANSAGAEALTPILLDALEARFTPETLVLRNDSPARRLEGLESDVRTIKGGSSEPLALTENGARFFADLGEGQNTGWFYDQRDNRAWAAGLAKGRRVLDAYCFSGGFGVMAALGGAESVTFLDRSDRALALAEKAADANAVVARCRFSRADAFNRLELLAKRQEKFGLVICDPPAFAKAKKDLPRAAKAYRKLARLGAELTEPAGFLVLSSCSHHIAADTFAQQVARGLMDAGRRGRILHQGGAGADHPLHPQLPESGYLKVLFLALD